MRGELARGLRADYLDQWQRFDDAAVRMGEAKHAPGPGALEHLSDKFTKAHREFSEAMGIGPLQLRDLLVAWRRAGWNQEDALRAVEAGLRELRGYVSEL